jgi:hypothetical protein
MATIKITTKQQMLVGMWKNLNLWALGRNGQQLWKTEWKLLKKLKIE